MKRCMVCIHTFESGTSCPRCRSEKTTSILNSPIVAPTSCVRVLHENFEFDEMLGLCAFKVGDAWFVNVNTWVDGANQFCVVSVPLNKFEELIRKVGNCEATPK